VARRPAGVGRLDRGDRRPAAPAPRETRVRVKVARAAAVRGARWAEPEVPAGQEEAAVVEDPAAARAAEGGADPAAVVGAAGCRARAAQEGGRAPSARCFASASA
jgi:hypothetical protein